MSKQLTAYNPLEVRKKLSLDKIKTWQKGGCLNEEQYGATQETYSSNLYSPNLIMRILMFIGSYIGMTTILGPILLLVGDSGNGAIRMMMFIVGIGIVLFTELVMIRKKHHFKSGITEAGYYTGFSFVYFAILGFEANSELAYWIVALVFLVITSIRYMDLLTLVGGFIAILAILFISFKPIISLLPFIVMVAFIGLFLLSQFLQKKADEIIWEDHFIILDSLCLLLVYLGGNYLVVRELSIEMMGLHLSEGEDIPYAYLFYGFTFLIPSFYLIWGIFKKSMLFIRVSLLVLTLSILTIKYYYNIAPPEVSITVAGIFLIVISLALIHYLKLSRNGFTRERIFKGKWDNTDLAAFVASQSLGGHAINQDENQFSGQGGEFGGGGASGEY